MSKGKTQEEKDREARAEQSQEDLKEVLAQQAPDAEQPGVSLASQDYEKYRSETAAAQDQPTATDDASDETSG